MRTASVSARKTTVSGAGRLTSQLPSGGAVNVDPGKVVRIDAVAGVLVRTTSNPLSGRPSPSDTCLPEAGRASASRPRSIERSARPESAARPPARGGSRPAPRRPAAGAPAGSRRCRRRVRRGRRRGHRSGRRRCRLRRREDLLPENEDAGADDDRENDPFFHVCLCPLGNWVYTTPAEGVTAREAPNHQPATPRGTVAVDRLFGIDRARGLETTRRAEERRQGPAVDPDQDEQQNLHRQRSLLVRLASSAEIGAKPARAA